MGVRNNGNVCDAHSDHPATVKVRRLNTGGGSGVYLCRAAWAREMAWRRRRNKTLKGAGRFPIRKWPG